MDIYDAKDWGNLDNKIRNMLVEKGPRREDNLKFSFHVNLRHFAYTYCSRQLPPCRIENHD
jgi:hypothetical protein